MKVGSTQEKARWTTLLNSVACRGIANQLGLSQDENLELNSDFSWQPVKWFSYNQIPGRPIYKRTLADWSVVIATVKDRLDLMQPELWYICWDWVVVIKLCLDEHVNEGHCNTEQHTAPYDPYFTQLIDSDSSRTCCIVLMFIIFHQRAQSGHGWIIDSSQTINDLINSSSAVEHKGLCLAR